MQLVSTKEIPEGKLRAAEKAIEGRSGRKTEVTVASIASQSEFAELMQRISTVPSPAPAPKPVEQGIDDIRAQVTARFKPVLDASWPQEVPLKNFSVAFGENGSVLNVNYEATRDMDALAVTLLQEQLRKALSDPALLLVPHRISPPKRAERRRAASH